MLRASLLEKLNEDKTMNGQKQEPPMPGRYAWPSVISGREAVNARESTSLIG